MLCRSLPSNIHHTAIMNVNINAKELQLVKQHNVRKEWAYVEIEELLGPSVNDNGDEVAQFQADPFIVDRFCMVWPKQKFLKQTIKGPSVGVAFQEQTSHFSPYKMDDSHNRQGCGSLEDADSPLLGDPQNPQCNEFKIQPADSTEVKTKELDSLLKECFEAYHLGHYGLSAAKYKLAWEMINNPTLKLRVEHIDEDVVCYMLCLSLLETNQLNNLSEAVELLVALEKRSSHKFPAVYYALSMAHHKHYRFALALKAAEEGLAFLQGNVKLIEQKIPGSDVTLEEFTKDGLSVSLAAMKDECSKWHPPDAVCCMGECLPSSRWYGPNRDIYFRDPAFNGMVVLTCSNARNPCTMKFHQACWKMRKDQLSGLKKLSDKDIIGYDCFTPNCEYGQGTRSLITMVDVYGDDGKLKTHIDAPTNPIQWMKRRSLPKGAIPKQQAKPKRQSEKIRRPVATTIPRSSGKEVMGENRVEKAWRLDKLAKLRQNNFGIKPGYEWRPDVEMYGNPQMMEIGDFLGDPIFENDSPKLVAIKTFIFDYFYEFIKENGCVKKIEISQKWEEDKFIFDSHSDVLHGETDICEFLLQSYKLVSLGDRIGIAANLPELYAIVRNEVCGCIKFLLADPLNSRLGHIQDDVSNTMINNSEKKQNKPSAVVVDSNAKIDRTVPLDKIQQDDMTLPVIVSPHSPRSDYGAVISPDTLSKAILTDLQEGWENIDSNTWNVTSKDISSLTEPKSSNDSADMSLQSVALPVPSECRLEPNDEIKLEEMFDPNDYSERSEDNTFDAESGTESDNCQTSSQFPQKQVDIVELGVDSEEEISDGVCNRPQDLELTSNPQETESNQNYHIHDSDSGNFKLDGKTDSMCDMNRDTQQMELQVDVTVRKTTCISTYNDAAEEAEPSGKEIFAANAYMAATEFPNGSFKEQRDCVELKQTETMETRQTITTALHTSQGQDTLAESNVQKIENDLAVMVKTVAQLKSLLEQNQARSENHAQMLQQELLNHKMVSQERMTELLKDLSRLETRCARLELEKSEIMHKFQECELDLRRINDENVGFTLKNTELMHKYDKLSEEKADIDNNFNLLLKEKSVIENNLEMVQKERDKMDKKLQKLHARLKDKSCADSEQISFHQKEQVQLEQKMLDAMRLNERKFKLQSLNHEFNINKYALEKAFEKCYDHITMLNDVCELVTLITGQQFIAGEVREAWQQTEYYLHHTIVQYKEDYSKLNALLESDTEIENLNDIKLPTLNIRFPQPPNLSELYRKGKAKLIRPQMPPVLPSQWLMSGGHYQAPSYFLPNPNAYYLGRNLETGVNDASNVAAGSDFFNNRFPQKFYPNDDTDNARPKGRSDRINGAEFQRNGNTTQPGPMIIAGAKPNVDNLTLNDAQNDDEGVSQASCDTNALEGASQISINRRSSSTKKIGRDLLMQELRKKFVGVPELDLLESVEGVRRLHKDTLSGMRLQDIIRESEPFVMELQAKHMAHYSPSKQMLPSERIHLQPNKPNQRKLPSSMPIGQQKRIRGGNQEQANKLGNNSTKVPAVVPAAMKKPAWGPVTTGLVEWKKNQEDSECTICFESMNVNDKRAPVYILPCQHSFHTTCIKKWLGENSICPICRIHCTMDDEFPPLPS